MDIVMDFLKLLHGRWHKLQLSKYYVSVKAKSCGLVVQWFSGSGTRTEETGSMLGTKTAETWHCCKYCNIANGRVDFDEFSDY
jgi:hypothetical protein